jgi:peptidoglycan/LPS O-acetylase OafA/YrhL
MAEAAHWFYLQNWLPVVHGGWIIHLAHFWSLGVEEQFYLVWPVVIVFAARRGLVRSVCLTTIAIAVAMRFVFWAAGAGDAANFATVTRMDTLAIGGYLAWRYRQPGGLRIAPRTVRRVLITTSLAWIAVVGVGGGMFRRTNHLIMPFGYLPLEVFWGTVLALALTATPNGLLRRLLRSSPARDLGRISYGVYVFHWPLVLMVQPYWRRLGWSYWATELTFLVLITLVSILAAELSFRLFETPFLRLKKRWAPQFADPTSAGGRDLGLQRT